MTNTWVDRHERYINTGEKERMRSNNAVLLWEIFAGSTDTKKCKCLMKAVCITTWAMGKQPNDFHQLTKPRLQCIDVKVHFMTSQTSCRLVAQQWALFFKTRPALLLTLAMQALVYATQSKGSTTSYERKPQLRSAQNMPGSAHKRASVLQYYDILRC